MAGRMGGWINGLMMGELMDGRIGGWSDGWNG